MWERMVSAEMPIAQEISAADFPWSRISRMILMCCFFKVNTPFEYGFLHVILPDAVRSIAAEMRPALGLFPKKLMRIRAWLPTTLSS